MKQSKSKTTVEFEQVIARGCGIDVHKEILVATIRGSGIKEQTREFGSFTSEIESLKDWLKEYKITHVAMESTGVYWKPVFNILEGDFSIVLANARHIKNVPGKKTDKKDSKWIAKLLLSGLISGSFIPPRHTRELRDLTRYKRKIVEQIASEKNRVHKFLEDANVKLSSVVSNLNGVTSIKIIDAMIAGEEDLEKLVAFHHGKMKASKEELKEALNGCLTNHHRFMLQTVKASIKEKEVIIAKLNQQIQAHIKDHEQELDRELLSTIPGVGKEGAEYILAEIGNDMSKFPDEKHLASWAGLSPGNNESAGKKKSSRITHGDKMLKAVIVQMAWAATRTKNTYLRGKYDSLVGHIGKKKALIAVGHKLLIAAYHILKDKVAYRELGVAYLQELKKDKQANRYLKGLRDLGYKIELQEAS